MARTVFRVGAETYITLFDDAMISMVYARNLVNGEGLIFSAGQEVEGYTNFLWTLWMASVHLLPLPDSKVSLVVALSGVALLVANVLVVWRVAAVLSGDDPTIAALAAWLTALYFPLVAWTLTGMEVGLIALLSSTSVLLAIRVVEQADKARIGLLAAALALGVLTRDDFLLSAVLVLGYVVSQAPRQARARVALGVGIGVLAAVAAHTALRLSYYGEPLPNTYYLKVTGVDLATRLGRGASSLAYTVTTQLYVTTLFALAAVLIRRAPRGTVLLAALVAGQLAYSVYVGGDAWENARYANRYITQAVPLLAVLAALGAGSFVSVSGDRRAKAALTIAGVALGAGIVSLLGAIPTVSLGFDGEGLLVPAVALLTAAGFLYLGLRSRRADLFRVGPLGRGTTLLALGLLMLLGLSGRPAADWARQNTWSYEDQIARTKYGLALRASTGSDAVIATYAAGAIPYYSGRASVDVLGKADGFVARQRPQPGPFRPGHNKWNYQHSLSRFRPDVATLWRPARDDLCTLLRRGYRQINPNVWALTRSRNVRALDLAAATRGLDLGGSVVATTTGLSGCAERDLP